MIFIYYVIIWLLVGLCITAPFFSWLVRSGKIRKESRNAASEFSCIVFWPGLLACMLLQYLRFDYVEGEKINWRDFTTLEFGFLFVLSTIGLVIAIFYGPFVLSVKLYKYLFM